MKSNNSITQELQQLSLEEQTKIVEDIHGIPDLPESNDTEQSAATLPTVYPVANNAQEETPEFLVQKLAETEHTLRHQIADKHKETYKLAMSINSDYITDPEYRLMFLRTDNFDPLEAAWRLLRHLEMKLNLFGKELLCQDIHQDDMEEKTLDTIYGGCLQLLPKRDNRGRTAFALFAKEQPEDLEDPHLHLLRRSYYMAMLGSRNVENQRAWKVLVVFPPPTKRKALTPAAAFRASYNTVVCIPIKVSPIHLCVASGQSKWMVNIMSTTAVVVDRMSRARFRFHCMPEMEILYSLLTYAPAVASTGITRSHGSRCCDSSSFMECGRKY